MRFQCRCISVTVSTPQAEIHYWLTIMFSQTLGTALGDWSAFILTRPPGAVVGDFLDKPVAAGGLALSRYSASAVLLLFMVACILFFRQRAAESSH